jgi:hypothetical protein
MKSPANSRPFDEESVMRTAKRADYLLDPSTGAILATVSNGDSSQFAQPFFADQYLLIATDSAGLYAYAPAG